ncbi:enoyl-CoA hydratase-related protein [Candidatus Thiothrix sp. Deng01]|uniref:Enoyl-CoA hydratase-related protein n=1 Tax=Candidatus Thiothrix phosphatis TaxID=3112415 RepID=A0ABU6D466_9GAMM|nr:enoyl-CoA hydratase-related protein [Candidatus Thiothrix sp. Deng01]MEB4593104.1 enoyl-CoA hydratase-related protein [Candidatus Thiothrix sp. Deng01]
MNNSHDFQTIAVSQRAPGVMQVTMSRPSVFNAFDDVMVKELDQAFTQLAEDDNVRVIILAGDGKHFSAGADLQWMQRASQASFDWNLEDARGFAGMFACIQSAPKPVIARVQGAALGGGTGLVCACDIAIAADNASFAISEAKFGILPAVIGPYVINAVGKRQAQRLAMTTTRIRADEALRLGLVQQVVDADQLDAAVDATVTELLASGPNALREIKQLYARLPVGDMTDSELELTAQTISRVRGTDEAREGFAAFLEKRPANWIPAA